jgi:hypothetical protein
MVEHSLKIVHHQSYRRTEIISRTDTSSRAMERLDRMFMEAAARAAAAETAGPSRAAPSAEAKEGDPPGGSGTVASQILKHIAGGDIFSALVLPKPECDDAGRPVWDVSDSEISKAFRKRSLAVHPDKNPSAEAKEAFDTLNDAVRVLRDPIKKGEALRRFASEAFQEKCRADPAVTERARKAQERADAVDFSEDILRQQREHRARVEAKRKKAAQFRERHMGPVSSSSSEDEEEDGGKDAEDKKKKSWGKHRRVSETAAACEGTRKSTLGGNKRGRGGVTVDESDSDFDDTGLAAPVLGHRGGRGRGRGRGGPRFLL